MVHHTREKTINVSITIPRFHIISPNINFPTIDNTDIQAKGKTSVLKEMFESL